MDALAGLLDSPRAHGAHLLRESLDPPWSVRVEDQAPVSLVALVRGEAWAVPDTGNADRLTPGAVAVVRGPDPYTFADHPDTPPQVVIHPGGHCTSVPGEDVSAAMDLGVRSWGTAPDAGTVLLVGTYQQPGEVGRRLLTALPSLLVLPPGACDPSLLALLDTELNRAEPGQAVVLDRLLDLLLVAVLRHWFSRAGTDAPAWYQAHHDPVVGRAVQLLHHAPARPWTVSQLAHQVGVSRPVLARRFTALVGQPPMTYLTHWRLTLAADLLREPGSTVQAVARRVGYGSGFALSTAFKRIHGTSPQHYARKRIVSATAVDHGTG